MLRSLSFRTKLIALGLVNIVLISSLAFTANWGIRQLNAMVNKTEQGATLLRSQMTADMMHDATKGTVLQALNVASAKGGASADTKDAILKDIAEIREKCHWSDSYRHGQGRCSRHEGNARGWRLQFCSG